ncbi:MAG: extracellular solute-binding protein [Chloroflexota bacterium]|nr:extracellular solute-binding protein [Chloroflexota bacterium]
MRGRPLLVPTMLASLVLVLAACNQGGGASSASNAPASGPAGEGGISGNLTTLGFSLPDRHATARIDKFQEEFPNVGLTVTQGDLDEQVFLSAVASGEPPDLVYMARNTIGSYVAQGVLQPLTDCIESAGIDMSQYREAAVNQVTIDGTVYGIPEFYNNRILFINNAVLEDAGLSADEVDWSDWDAILALNEELAVVDGDTVSRIGFDPKLPEFLPLWVYANGGAMLSEDGTESLLDTPEVIEALEWATSFMEPYGGAENFYAFRGTWDFFGGENEFVQNQLGAFAMEQWYVGVLAENSPDVDITFQPVLSREGDPITFADGNAWAMPVGAKNPEAACEFMRVMTETETWVEAAQAQADFRAESDLPYTGTYTANTEADERIFGEIVEPSGNEAFDNAQQVILEVQDNAYVLPPAPAAAEFDTAWRDAVQRVFDGDQTVEEALAQADQEAQDALDAAASGG